MALIEFPADDPERALRFWGGLLDVDLEPRPEGEGSGWQSRSTGPPIGVHARGPGPGDTVSLPYFGVDDMAQALERVEELGGSIVHPGERWSICKGLRGKSLRVGCFLIRSRGHRVGFVYMPTDKEKRCQKTTSHCFARPTTHSAAATSPR